MKSPFYANGLNQSFPFYTTRKSGRDNETASYSASLWMVLLFFGMIWLNAVIWGGIGLYEAARLVFG